MPTILELAAEHRRRLAAREAEAVRGLVQAYGVIWQRLRAQVDALLDEVEALRAAGQEPSPGMVIRLERAQQLLRQVEEELRGVAPYAEAEIRRLQADGLTLGEETARQMVMQGVRLPSGGIAFPIHRMDVGAVQAMVGFLSDGSPLRDLLAGLGPDAAQAVRDALIVGIGTGLSPREVARMTRRAFGGALDRALLVARTEMMRAARTAQLETFRANADVMAGWIWFAHIHSDRTCPVCIAMHGTFHTLDETMDSHPACRCAMIPWTRSWEELGFPGIPDRRTRVEPGVEWFARQDAATQRRILGPAKYAAYQAGDLELMDLVGVKTHPRWGRTRFERSLRSILGERQATAYIREAMAAD